MVWPADANAAGIFDRTRIAARDVFILNAADMIGRQSPILRIVSWNIDKRLKPWRELAEMARNEQADVALLQEAGNPPDDVADRFPYKNDGPWDPASYDRWCLVVPLSNRVEVEHFRQVAPVSEPGNDKIAVSGIGTIAAARVIPHGRPREAAFIAVSMYARWIKPHPSTQSTWMGASDVSAHRIISDLSAFVGHNDPSRHRILAAGDLNMFLGVTGRSLSLPERESTVWKRMKALGLECLGPQAPNGRQAASPPPDVPANTGNVPTCYNKSSECPATATRQLDYAFASRGFHESVTARALNKVDEWGSSDHCRLLMEIDIG